MTLLLNGDYEYSVYFQQHEHGQWHEAASSGGHAGRSVLTAIDERP